MATVRTLLMMVLLSAIFPLVFFPAAGIGDSRPLDLYWSYSPGRAYQYLGSLGSEGRVAYARMLLTSDLLFPLVYSLALTVLLTLMVRSLPTRNLRFHYIHLSPLLIIISDWGENLALATVIHALPERHDTLVRVASFFTSLKWISLAAAIAAVVVIGVLLIVRRLQSGSGN